MKYFFTYLFLGVVAYFTTLTLIPTSEFICAQNTLWVNFLLNTGTATFLIGAWIFLYELPRAQCCPESC